MTVSSNILTYPQPESNGLTPQDVATLTRVFDLDDYEFKPAYGDDKASKRDNQLYLTYVGEEAVITRLNEVDPNWSLTLDRVEVRGNSYAAYGTLTVKGVIRQGVGTGDGANGEKGAATDLLKRLARLFGIGVHLKRSPNIWVASSLAKWEAESAARTRFGKWLNNTASTPPSPTGQGSVKSGENYDQKYSGTPHRFRKPDGSLDPTPLWKELTEADLRTEFMARIEEAYGITDARNLTPQQAIDAFEHVIAQAEEALEDTQEAESGK